MRPRDLVAQPVPPSSAGDAEDKELSQELGDERKVREGMLPTTISAWLRARFKEELIRRFRGAAEDEQRRSADELDGITEVAVKMEVESRAGTYSGVERFVKADASFPSLRISFALPVASYATTFLQHLTGEGLKRGRSRSDR